MNPFNNFLNCTNGTNVHTEPLTLAKIEAMVSDLAASTPQEWLLISPQGVMTKGTDPMRLAARASHEARGYVFAGLNTGIQA